MHLGSAEGEAAANSQAKGPNSDDTLERQWGTEEVNPYCISRGEIFQVQKTETHRMYSTAFTVRIFCAFFDCKENFGTLRFPEKYQGIF